MGRKVLGKNTLQNVIFVTLRMYFMTKMTQYEIKVLKRKQFFISNYKIIIVLGILR